MVDENGKHFDGYVSSIALPNGKVYKLQCEIVEVYPMQCPRCGGQVELHCGIDSCKFCGTSYSTQFKIVEE